MSTTERVTEVVTEQARLLDVSVDASKDLHEDFDELDRLELMFALEEEFDVDLDDAEFEALRPKTIESIAGYIERNGGGRVVSATNRVAEVVAKLLGVPKGEVDEAANLFDDLGVDLLELMFALEVEFAIDLGEPEFMTNAPTTVNGIAEYIERKGGAS